MSSFGCRRFNGNIRSIYTWSVWLWRRVIHMKTEVVKSQKRDDQEHPSIDDGHEKCHLENLARIDGGLKTL